METLATILTSKDFLSSIPSVILLVVAIVILGKVMHVKVHTSHFTIGGESAEAYYERKIVQEQCDYVHSYLLSLIGKITEVCPDHELKHNGWMTKCILEYAYDEFVTWIHYNHITDTEAYVSVKQNKIISLVYSQPVRHEFETPEFRERIKRWVAEIITELVRIRKVYTEEMRKGDR